MSDHARARSGHVVSECVPSRKCGVMSVGRGGGARSGHVVSERVPSGKCGATFWGGGRRN